MICPSCGTGIRLDGEEITIQLKEPDSYGSGCTIEHGFCPQCDKLIISLHRGDYRWMEDQGELVKVTKSDIIYPKQTDRLLDTYIPELYRDDFNEAYSVRILSPKSSATLSRRLLQKVLREEFHLADISLNAEIDKFLQKSGLPTLLSESVDAIRTVGNFAAHPMKYQNTAEIAVVEPGEAEWLLEVLELLLDYTFVQPRKLEERRNALNTKLQALGKPALK